jgi:hypothetical protein
LKGEAKVGSNRSPLKRNVMRSCKYRMKTFYSIVLILCFISPDAWASAPATEVFDRYGTIGWQDEKARLDNLAIFLMENPKFVGYIFVWAGRQACPGEAQARAQRAKKYLVEYRRIGWSRVIWKDAGFRDEGETILQPFLPGNRLPEFDSLVKRDEVQFLKNCRGGLPYRKKKISPSAAHNKRLQRTRREAASLVS